MLSGGSLRCRCSYTVINSSRAKCIVCHTNPTVGSTTALPANYVSAPLRVKRMKCTNRNRNNVAWTAEQRKFRIRPSSGSRRVAVGAWWDTAGTPSVWRHVSDDVFPANRPISGIPGWSLRTPAIPISLYNVLCIPLSVGSQTQRCPSVGLLHTSQWATW